MKAGRELDALVAEKVMGHKVKMWNDVRVRKIQVDIPLMQVGEFEHEHIPRYSSIIADAWQVVEKLSSQGSGVEIYQDVDCPCECTLYMRNGKNIYQKADTAQLAICLAAIKAAGVEVDC